jgi:hypothetical protein
MATCEKEKPERPFGVSAEELESIRMKWRGKDPGQGLFEAPVVEELQYYFSNSLSYSRFAVDNVKFKTEDPATAAKLEAIGKSLTLCSDIAKIFFRHFYTE